MAVGGGPPERAGVEAAEELGGGERRGVMEIAAFPKAPEWEQPGPVGAGLVDAGVEQGVLARGKAVAGESRG